METPDTPLFHLLEDNPPSHTKGFETLQEAFDYCREVDHPVYVMAETRMWKLYPSGKAEPMRNPQKEKSPYACMLCGAETTGEHLCLNCRETEYKKLENDQKEKRS